MSSKAVWSNRSKGQTLEFLANRLTRFHVPDFLLISVVDWESAPRSVAEDVRKRFGDRLLAVRSSASDEDGEVDARAGEYESVLNVSGSNREELFAAVSKVVDSYSRNHDSLVGHEIIVQEMVDSVALSGVCFTHELNSGAPYYVVNYDDVSRTTVSVTSGVGENANRTLYIHRGAVSNLRSERFRSLISAVMELENVLESDFLDVEFAVDENLKPHLLQARRITTRPNWNRGLSKRVNVELGGIQRFVSGCFTSQSGVYGSTTAFGQMPDWKPAEMIGRAPRSLALTLYRNLITDNAWRIARKEMGYAVPAGQHLMVSLAGQPFVDTRISFHSYLPTGLPESISTKLVNEWVARLKENPELHDKVEFDVAITCFSFDIDERLSKLASGLNKSELNQYRNALRDLTAPLIKGDGEGSIAGALVRVEKLAALNSTGLNSDLACLFRLVEECALYGTVPFAILARHAFIAKTILLSLVKCGIFSENDVGRFQASVSTVAGQMLDDIRAVQGGTMREQDFLEHYGHLRPGTYDILSPRYDQMKSLGITLSTPRGVNENPIEDFSLAPKQRAELEQLLSAEGLGEIGVEDLLKYCAEAIAGREYGKFVFTRSVSAMLELIATYGESHGLSREEMSHVPLEALMEIGRTSSPSTIEDKLRNIATENANHHHLTSAVRLPQVLFDEAGVHIVPFQTSQPNFVTSKDVSAGAVHLRLGEPVPPLTGQIVLVENADPGYDWIFAHSIAGLVTKYGGANSHMAIRCAEFGIPAAIGCGEQLFDSLTKADHISFDCSVGFISASH